MTPETCGFCGKVGKHELENDPCPMMTSAGTLDDEPVALVSLDETGEITEEQWDKLETKIRARNTAAERHVARTLQNAKDRAKKLTPKPSFLTWSLRQDLHYRYGWTPYY